MSLDIRNSPFGAFGAYPLAEQFLAGENLNPDAPPTQASAGPVAGTGEVIDANAGTKQQIQSLFKEQFGAIAADQEKFHETMRQVFGDGYDAAKAEQYRQAALRGDYSWLPPIKFVSGETLGGGNGAFSAGDGCVYLNADLKDDPQLLAQVYVEEAGHFLDSKINKNDAAGDEGELFRRVLSGEQLSRATVAAIKAENDHGTIVVDGEVKEVEFWFGSDLVKGAKKAIDKVTGAAKDAVDAVGKTAGKAIDAVSDAADKALDKVKKGIDTAISKPLKTAGDVARVVIRTTGAAWANTLSDVGNAVTDVAHRVGRAAGKAIKSAGAAITGAATSLLEGGEMVLNGIGDGITGFGKNLLKGKVGEAFNSLIRGVDKATFGALLHVGDGLIEAAQKWFAAPTYLLPFGGKWVRDNVIPWAGDMIHTAFNTAVEIGRDMARMTPEILLGMGTDLYQSGKALFQGDILGALKELGMVVLNARARAVGGIVDAGMHLGQGILSIGSTALGIEKPGRHLTAEEEALLRQVYGNSIDYDTVRIKHGGASNLMAPHTVGNTIYIPDNLYNLMHDSSGNLTEFGARLLTHETAHVWQSQNGGGDYIHKSLWSQSIGIVTGGSRNLAYLWRTAVGAGVPFDQLNVEQQANVFEELGVAFFRDAHGGDNDGRADIGEFNIDQDNNPKTGEPGLTNAEYGFVLAAARHARRGEWS